LSDTENGAERIAKRLAHAGIASRRDAEKMIAEGRVSVNGVTLETPAFKVGPADDVRVDGKPVGEKPPTRLWRHHKPVGRVTTHRDPEGRETVFDQLPSDMGRVISVGRLDLNSEGLLLLTNDGELARLLELPATGWTRRYRVRAFGDVDDAALERLKKGITVEGVAYGPVEAMVDRRTGANIWLTVGLEEGKNREVRKVLAAVGLKVNRLVRIAYGPFQLGALKKGETEEVRRAVLRDQLGAIYPALGGDAPIGTAKAKTRKVTPGQRAATKRKPAATGALGNRPLDVRPRKPRGDGGPERGGKPDAHRRRRS